MRVRVIIVGIGQWEEYTEPLVKSIRKFEPDVQIIIVDNGHRYLPERSKEFIKYDLLGNISIDGSYNYSTEFQKPVSYAEAINSAFYILPDKIKYYDWTIVTNNDVICYAPFVKYLENLQDNIIYGNNLHYSHKRFESPTPWIDGWIYAVPKKILKEVGKWDEKFKIAGFEDADYCIRAYNKGYGISISELPFTHLGEHIRKSFYNYNQIRSENIEYLIEKHGLRKIS